MNIKVWTNFTKRKNSTLQPTGGTDVVCVLKEETSIETPSFILNTPIANYTYVQAFGHYYFVTDVINLDANRCEISCTMDVLASYKSAIISYTAFVERSASLYDPYINDPLLSSQQLIIRDDLYVTPLTNFFDVNGSFVLEVMNKYDGIVLYVMTDLEPMNKIFMPGTYQTSDVAEWIDSKIAQAFDLDVYIGTVKWMPFSPTGLSAIPTNSVDLGPVRAKMDEGVTVYKVANRNTSKHFITYLTVPTSGFYDDFRDTNDAYTQYTLSLPGVGFVPLNTDFVGSCIRNNMQIGIDIYVDLVSGDITYDISSYEATQVNYKGPFAQFKGNVSVDVPIGKSSGNPLRTLSIFSTGLGSVFSGGMSGGSAGAVSGATSYFSSILSAYSNNIRPQVSMIGGSGNKSDMRAHTTISLTRRQYGTKEFAQTVAGRPLMRNVLLSTLSGFVKCGNASVPVNCNDSERDTINSYLNSGIYIE